MSQEHYIQKGQRTTAKDTKLDEQSGKQQFEVLTLI